jgi:hypothetical protein
VCAPSLALTRTLTLTLTLTLTRPHKESRETFTSHRLSCETDRTEHGWRH